MTDANALYNYSSKVANELAKIKEDPFNSEILLKYYRSRVAGGLSLARILKCLNTLKLISKSFGKSFEQATKDDIIDFVGSVEQRDISPWAKHDYKIILKHFYKWLRESENPPEVSWIKVTRNIPNNLQKKTC